MWSRITPADLLHKGRCQSPHTRSCIQQADFLRRISEQRGHEAGDGWRSEKLSHVGPALGIQTAARIDTIEVYPV